MDRAEATGLGVAIVGHGALILALALALATSITQPRPPEAMEVSFIEDTGPVSSAPETSDAPAPSVGEEIGPTEEASGADSAVPEALPEAVPESPPPQPVQMSERRRPDVTRDAVPIRPTPQPQRVAQNQPRPAPQRPQPAGQGQAQQNRGALFDRLTREFGRAPTTRPGTSPQPQAATVTPQVRASFVAMLGRQIARCSSQQRPASLEARSLRPVVRIRLNRDGSLNGAPAVVRVEGADGRAAQYEQQARDAIVRAVRSCAPYSGLPPELFDVPNGWREPPLIRLNFQ